MRRTNADKRRCVEIALAEFGSLSSRAIAEMCGVALDTVLHSRPEQVNDLVTSKVTGSDGKQHAAKHKPKGEPAEAGVHRPGVHGGDR